MAESFEKTSGHHQYINPKIDKSWLNLQRHPDGQIKKPDDLIKELKHPPEVSQDIFDRVRGSMIGMALGDALGARVEFRPHTFLKEHPVTKLQGGGTWGLKTGQFTDDTSMALCLANSLVACQDFIPYDQLVRYKWWYKHGYMSSTGKCFDIGEATKNSIREFERRQNKFAKEHSGISEDEMDNLSEPRLLREFDVYCSAKNAAGNGGLMRLTPVPLFFYRHAVHAVKFSGISAEITHGDPSSTDACRYYGALIVAALNGESKKKLLANDFYHTHKEWFENKPLHESIWKIANGSFKEERGHAAGIRGKGYVVKSLEAALWAFWSDKNCFEKSAFAAVNLGDDTDTTAAIYGQLAGAYYGYEKIPLEWRKKIYANEFINCLSEWIVYEGEKWKPDKSFFIANTTLTSQSTFKNTTDFSNKPDQNFSSSSSSSQSTHKQDFKLVFEKGQDFASISSTTD